MTEWIQSWLMGVTGAAMVLALAECLTPEGSVKRICRTVGGVVLLLAAISPVVKLEEAELSQITQRYHIDAQEFGSELEKKNDFLYESIIAENASAYILDKAQELGMTCQVSVTVGWEDGTPRLAAATVKGTWTVEQKNELSQILESDLGIPASLQYFKEKDL